MSDRNAHWRSLVDDGYQVELAGAAVDTLDARWIAELAIKRPEPPERYRPVPDYELMEHAVSWTRLWRDAVGYRRQETVRRIYELKPELIV